ncbi:MAG: formate dehydrogenase accessory protein FdhE [Bacillota bacterium]|nr:formate dehydrogenase accessory protein FdhE [Bacillota bacterium]
MNQQLPVHLPDGYMAFYQELENWQNLQQIKLKKTISMEKHDMVSLLSTHHKPLLNLVNFTVDMESYKEIYNGLLVFLKEHRQDIGSTVDTIDSLKEHFDFDCLISKLLDEDQAYLTQFSKQYNLPAELFIFTIDHSLRPYLRLFAEPYHEALIDTSLEVWDSPAYCPICGSKSHFSRLRKEDGRRFLFCDRCFSEWETRYLSCVHCGNGDPGTIKYFCVEDDGAYRIYICEQCKGYLKTYDERQEGKQTDLFLANMETIYLDLLAQEKGYISHDYTE